MTCMSDVLSCFFFFFQAEDGIRDVAVTGVQTCALPISGAAMSGARCCSASTGPRGSARTISRGMSGVSKRRSEERRVGKSVDLGGRRIIKKKKKERRERSQWKKKQERRKDRRSMSTREQ